LCDPVYTISDFVQLLDKTFFQSTNISSTFGASVALMHYTSLCFMYSLIYLITYIYVDITGTMAVVRHDAEQSDRSERQSVVADRLLGCSNVL